MKSDTVGWGFVVLLWLAGTAILCSVTDSPSEKIAQLQQELDDANTKIKAMRIKVPNIENINMKPKMSYEEMEVEATAYANVEECCSPYFDGITSTGRDANLGGVAVDPKVIPYGSMIVVDGIGVLQADDTGGAIKGKKIDIRFPNGDITKALNWGRKTIKIKVYRK